MTSTYKVNKIRTVKSLSSEVFRSLDVGNSGQVVCSNPCYLDTLDFLNWANSVNFFKVYNKSTAATSGDTPVMTVSAYLYKSRTIEFDNPVYFSNGISIRATTGIADNNTTSPSTNSISCTITYHE